MHEADLIEQLFSVYDRYWTIVQWWASVSFSLIVVAYFAAHRLSKAIVATLLFLYALYSAWVYLLMLYNIDISEGLLADLETLRVAGQLTSQGALAAAQNPVNFYGAWLGVIAQLATFVACVGYFLHAFAQARRSTPSGDALE